ncbi:MAG: RluA family pseudouridine synthase [Planctomycetota bacterium]|nr:RluA family pseudouridine synthase [Planctomycetota bacterium]
MSAGQSFVVDDGAGCTLGTALRRWNPGTSWSQVRRLLLGRYVTVNRVLCLDEARRLMAGDVVVVEPRPLPPPPSAHDIVVHFADQQVIVVQKPSGMISVRPPQERHWSRQRRDLQPTLDELLERRFPESSRSRGKERLYPMHRIDRDTSGLLLFARSPAAHDELVRQFASHRVARVYYALVRGGIEAQTIRTTLVRDRGDGRRGSTKDSSQGKHAVTHVRIRQILGEYRELECRLETGRTNQIRIHLAELGFPICGDGKYRGPMGQDPLPDESLSPRLALHAAQLGFVHPHSHEPVQFETPWPVDITTYLDRLKNSLASK